MPTVVDVQGTRVEGTINKLFEGHTYNFIECVNIEYKSTRKESFMDIQLDVKGCKNIYESFDRYTETEMLDGPNQYNAEQHGLQDARKGVSFDSFPPVLQLQLKRFEYDFQRDIMVKVGANCVDGVYCSFSGCSCDVLLHVGRVFFVVISLCSMS